MDVVSLLSTISNEAVDEGLIGANPCRRPRINTGGHVERPTVTATQVPHIAARARFMDRVLIVMAAYTGMRWDELAGLQWSGLDLEASLLTIDGKDGALHEVGGTLSLGPPKTKPSAHVVHLPPFSVNLLSELRVLHPTARFMFTAAEGGRVAQAGELPAPGMATRHHRRPPTRMGADRTRAAFSRPAAHPQNS
jgi:integrase